MGRPEFLRFSKEWHRIVDGERDYNRFVPKEYRKNLEFRQKVILACEADDEIAHAMWLACKRDLLFCVNTFFWMQESREGVGTQYESKIFPWITWPVQDWVLTHMQASVGKEHFVFTKPRAAAASWCAIALFFYQCLFESYVNFGVSSAKEDKVDAKDDPSSVMGKLDLLIKHTPKFLLPVGGYDRGPCRFKVHETNSTIMGYASTSDLNTGGRNTAFLMDEFGDFPTGKDYDALETMHMGVTNSIFLVSTYNKRRNCAFNATARDDKFPAKRIRVTWEDCPPQAAGLYVRQPGQPVEILDKDYKFPEGYKFIDDGQHRSPYYDIKSAGMSKQQIARQLLADDEGSSPSALDQAAVLRCLEKARAENRLAPLLRGSLSFSLEEWGTDDFKVQFIPDANGPLSLWCKLENGKASALDAYAEAADLSSGVGHSNSVICIFSRSTGKQVAEYVTAFDTPRKVARIAAALGWMFGGYEELAFLTFDCKGGPGAEFRDEIKMLEYGHIHERTVKDEVGDRRSKKLGYAISSEGPGDILSDLIEAMDGGRAELRSEPCYAEFNEYVWQKGKIVHGGAVKGIEESEAIATHGDRAVAAGMAWHLCRLQPMKPRENVEKRNFADDPPYGCLAWRMREHEKRQADTNDELVFS